MSSTFNPRKVPRLLQDRVAELGIGVVAKVDAFIDEALAVRIQHHTKEVAYFAIVFPLRMRQIKIAIILHVQVHGCGVAALKCTVPGRTGRPSHIQPVSGIVRRAPHLRHRPVPADEFCTHGLV